MNIFITGGGGFLGASLAGRLKADNSVTLADIAFRSKPDENKIRYIKADLQKSGEWQGALADQDVVINLAGVPIFSRWTKSLKEAIYGSRIAITHNLVEALKNNKGKDVSLLSASAVGYYGFHEDEVINESFPGGTDFLAEVATNWEAEANRASESGIRVVNCRFGVILGRGGGAMKAMEPIYRFFLGSRLGNGRQWFSWIHLNDLVNALIHIIEKRDISGPVNCTAPNPVRNSELNRGMLRAFRRPPLVPFTPGFVIKVLMGEMGNVLLKGQRAVPEALLKSGYQFRFPDLEKALQDIYG
jgi:uncharacterized protein (TIGR01777 family)